MKNIIILSAQRTPMGNFLGALKDCTTTDLGSTAIAAALEESHLKKEEIDEVFMGCVLPAGLGQAPARQAALKAGLLPSTGCTTINKVCGSGLKAIMLGHDLIQSDSANIVIAGGMESMSNTPYLLKKARTGYRLGHGELIDHLFYDGLEDAYDKGRLMGCFAEDCVKHFKFTREEQDAFAMESLKRAHTAQEKGWFDKEISPVTVKNKQEELIISKDELPSLSKIEKIPLLKPVFQKDGTVTAANSSSITDGAAAVVLMSAHDAEKKGLTPIARIVAHATHSQEPHWFSTAPIGAIEKLLLKTGWKLEEVDLFEINEAFAVVVMAAMKKLNIPHEKVNVHGGACALGHPIGASGARLLVTLIHALKQRGSQRGIATLCLGGGEAVAVAVEI